MIDEVAVKHDRSVSIESLFDSFERAIKKEGSKPYLIKLAFLTIAYAATAKLGFSLAFNFEQITTIWPPSGIAVAALLLWGYYYWPGIFVGAFMANALSGASPVVAVAIALGNTIGGLASVYMVKRFIGIDILGKISSIIGFIVLAAFLSPIVNATAGTAALLAGDVITSSQLLSAWTTWWVGDMIGILLVVPLIVAWSKKEYREPLGARLNEAIAMLLLVVMTSLVIFTQGATANQDSLPLTYMVFPLIILAAVRFTQIGAVTTGAIVTIAAVWSTVTGLGPYVKEDFPERGLLVLHFFILIIMLTALVLSVAVYGRLRSEQALAKKAKQLEQARQQILKNVEWRKDLQDQMKEAQDSINNILLGIFESDTPKKPPS
jgi:integral membrane sensor domain MASE1